LRAGVRSGWIPSAFLIGHLADHKIATLHLLTDHVELGQPFLLGTFSRCLHSITSSQLVIGTK
jgi:hypothetical protein